MSSLLHQNFVNQKSLGTISCKQYQTSVKTCLDCMSDTSMPQSIVALTFWHKNPWLSKVDVYVDNMVADQFKSINVGCAAYNIVVIITLADISGQPKHDSF